MMPINTQLIYMWSAYPPSTRTEHYCFRFWDFYIKYVNKTINLKEFDRFIKIYGNHIRAQAKK